jgi:hypothetical protein
MKIPIRLGAVLIGALMLVGCSAPAAVPVATTSATASGGRATATPAATTTAAATPGSATVQAIKTVIQQANAAEQRAFARNDPTLMQATATAAYYAQLVQDERAMQQAGVSAIALVQLDWGPVSVQETTAQATTEETWQITQADGGATQDTERNVYTLVEQGGAWKVQADDHPDASVAPTGGGTGAGPASTGVSQSQNWAGYAATGADFTAVSATWKVPAVTDDGGTAADATWVGIGGVTATDLIQAGTQATVQGGQVTYAAWIETLPEASREIPLAVGAGDTVGVSIAQQSDGEWAIVVQDQTTGRRYQTTVAYTSSHSSAEWVEEAPASGRWTVPLDDFGAVAFQQAAAVAGGKTETIAQAGGQAITMVDRTGETVAQPSALGGDGASFSVSRVAAPSLSGAPASGSRFGGAGAVPFPGR